MKLNDKQAQAVELVDKGNNVYISGPGGMGKSFLLNFFRERDKESAVFVAPTGISALNINCSTAHSTFGLAPKIYDTVDYRYPSDRARELFGLDSPVKRIYLDEIPMYRADLFKVMDFQLRTIRRSKLPFGGLQVVTVGDFYQLSPVLTNNEEDVYRKIHGEELFCFDTKSWSAAKFEHIELTQPMRHSETEMIENLQNIRMKREGWEQSLEFFNHQASLYTDQVFEEDGIFLCVTNKSADYINNYKYQELGGKEYTFVGVKKGKADRTEPAPLELKVKIGTKLLCVANDGELRNGMIVYFLGMTNNGSMTVETEEGIKINCGKYKWKNYEYSLSSGFLDHKEIGSYTQFPFKLGYAITVHKSQGCTLKRAIIERGNRGFFCHGQAYVSLSRISTLQGVGMMTPMKPKDIIVDKKITEFYDNDCRGMGLF